MNCSVHLANEETHLETTSDFLLDFPKLLKILSSNCSVCVSVEQVSVNQVVTQLPQVTTIVINILS